jgi:viologen exporter family transport system permease protein
MWPWGIERGSGLLRYLKLFGMLVKVGLMKQMAYPPHFFLMITGKTLRIALLFFFYQAIFFKINRIGQWSYDQVLLLFATFQMVDYLISITFQRNLASSLPRRIQTGELDARLVLPTNLLFLVSLEEVDMMDFFSFLPSLGFLFYVLYRLQFAFTWTQVLLYLGLLASAILFLYAISLIVATTSFWTTQSIGLAGIFDDLLKIGRYPLDIFTGFWKIVFLYFLPLVVIAQIPAQALLNTLHPAFALFSCGVAGLSLWLALGFWRMGLRHYSSPGT